MTVMSVDALGVLKQGSDGRTVWTSAENGAQGGGLPEGVVLAVADFYRDAKLSELYSRTKLLGKVREGDRDIYMIEAAPRSGTAEKLYFDAESGLHYNYFRDYDPELGRYVQADRIGLLGASLTISSMTARLRFSLIGASNTATKSLNSTM